MRSPLPALAALLVALVLGVAPWRMVASAEAGHGGMWLPGVAHDHDHEHPDPHGPATTPACAGHGACDHEHAPASPHCHCDDAPAVPGLACARVVLAAPSCTAATLWSPDEGLLRAACLAAPEGPRPRAWRVACEEEPTVLLR